jgi:hypothetical protein
MFCLGAGPRRRAAVNLLRKSSTSFRPLRGDRVSSTWQFADRDLSVRDAASSADIARQKITVAKGHRRAEQSREAA